MARIAFRASIGQSLGEGQYAVTAGRATDISTPLASAVALQAALDVAQAAAVAKGTADASAEITATGVAITAYEAAVNAANTASGVPDLQVSINLSTITSRNQLKRAFDAILRQALGDGNILP